MEPILSYADVVDRVSPAVVTIRASRRVRAPQQFPFFDDPFFRQFFGGTPRQRGGGTQVEHALGSGVIVQADGHILTNHHVIDGAEDIKVDLNSTHSYSAKLVGSDAPSDLAVLKISANDLPVLQLGDSDKVRVGDVCLAIGNPLAVGKSVTAGIISAKGRSTDNLGGGSYQDFLQTDAPINQGNSGGALVNTRGELIGINSQILSSNGGGNIGIGFAIPSNMAKTVMDSLLKKGKVQRGMLGVGIQPVTADMAPNFGMKEPRGVVINSVTPGGPADKAGLKTGDVILQLNGKDVNDTNTLRNEIASAGPGTEVTLTVLHDGKQEQVKARLVELTANGARPGEEQGGGDATGSKLGISVVPLTPDILQQLGLRRGTQGVAVESVDPSGPAAQAGIQTGDVIQEVNRQPVRSPSDIASALQKSGDRAPLLLINRGGQTAYVSVPLQ
ncbi:MAG TPA: Do family serine endopeptidase [Bryobacteraceae bacterium]|nr:Do family serine endopeptidase [Bryobacteraceae bacterium]